MRACIEWEDELQDNSIGLILIQLFQEISKKKHSSSGGITLGNSFKIAKEIFKSNKEAYNYYVRNVTLLSLANYKNEKGFSDFTEISKAKQKIREVEEKIKQELLKYEGEKPYFKPFKPEEKRMSCYIPADILPKYIETIKTKLLGTNEGLIKTIKKQFDDSMALRKGCCK